MYVYVCMYVCTYVCMYVCMYVYYIYIPFSQNPASIDASVSSSHSTFSVRVSNRNTPSSPNLRLANG